MENNHLNSPQFHKGQNKYNQISYKYNSFGYCISDLNLFPASVKPYKNKAND